MIEKKGEKSKQIEHKQRDEGVELENQFILRMPEEPAQLLHEAIQSGGVNLKDRFNIKIEPDLRYGEVRFDHWLLHAKIVDLPTIMESMKTIDNKSFYKTADVCQLMICKEEPDAPSADDESPNKAKKKDPNKVDKKYLWPHGITPPCKNIRKRRFRKTLKKKYVEAPEIEKEVKRLLRIDNDAVHVKYEIINEDEETKTGTSSSKEQSFDNDDLHNEEKLNENSNRDINVESDGENETPSMSQNDHHGVAEHDIFGGEVSSSDDEERPIRRDIEENSRLSGDDSRLSDYSMPGMNSSQMVTEFSKSMFNSPRSSSKMHGESSSNMGSAFGGFYEEQKTHPNDYDDDYSNEPQLSRDQINVKISELRRQCDDFKVQQSQKALEIASIQNPTLKQRMQETLDNILSQIVEKEMEIQDYQNMLM